MQLLSRAFSDRNKDKPNSHKSRKWFKFHFHLIHGMNIKRWLLWLNDEFKKSKHKTKSIETSISMFKLIYSYFHYERASRFERNTRATYRQFEFEWIELLPPKWSLASDSSQILLAVRNIYENSDDDRPSQFGGQIFVSVRFSEVRFSNLKWGRSDWYWCRKTSRGAIVQLVTTMVLGL